MQGVKIVVNTDRDPNDWAEIDAVRLLGPSVGAFTAPAGPTPLSVTPTVAEDTSTTDGRFVGQYPDLQPGQRRERRPAARDDHRHTDEWHRDGQRQRHAQ